jgi:hypothetical protein
MMAAGTKRSHGVPAKEARPAEDGDERADIGGCGQRGCRGCQSNDRHGL